MRHAGVDGHLYVVVQIFHRPIKLDSRWLGFEISVVQVVRLQKSVAAVSEVIGPGLRRGFIPMVLKQGGQVIARQ